MNILYSGDGNICDGVIISALSLCRNAKEPINIYILTATVCHGSTVRSAVGENFVELLERYIKQYNTANTVTLTDLTDLFMSEQPTANMETRFTPCCMLRLYTDLAEELPDRILYLDNDVVCRADPSEFYHQDMTDYSLAGSLDYYGSWFFKRKPFVRDYLNSGVLLLNLKKIRQNGLFAECRKKCRDEEMFMPDQSAINKLCRDKKICHRKYNEQRKEHTDTVFRHFTTSFRFFPLFHTVSVKPWNRDGMHNILHTNEYDDLLDEYNEVKRRMNDEFTKSNTYIFFNR